MDAVRAVERAGAHGITLHLREDRRHVQDEDVWTVRRKSRLPLNLEMALHPEILAIALEVRPEEVCIVPERRLEVTTEGGLDADGNRRRLVAAIRKLHQRAIGVSLFIGPERKQIRAAADCGADFIELHTGAFAEAPDASRRKKEWRRLRDGAEQARAAGLRVNAGHGINYANIREIGALPHIETLNIGHTIVSRAVQVGMEPAVRELLRRMRGA